MPVKTASIWTEDAPPAAAFDLGSEVLAELIGPLSSADDALARLDERLSTSPVRAGCVARIDVAESCAALRAEGELVHLEDLVLHDYGMDVRSPSHELVRAHAYLRLRRRAARGDPRTLLSPNGLLRLAGRAPDGERIEKQAGQGSRDKDRDGAPDERAGLDESQDELDAAFANLTTATQAAAEALGRHGEPAQRDPLIYGETSNEARAVARFCAEIAHADALPPLIGALVLAHAWTATELIQRQAQLAPVVAGIYLRQRGRTRAHLACFHLGLRALPPRQRIGSPRRKGLTLADQLRQDLGIVEAGAREILAQHDRLLLARELLAQKGRGRRETSNLPRLCALVLDLPLVTVPLIAQKLAISPQAAQVMVADLAPILREITGRKRYRAWTIG